MSTENTSKAVASKAKEIDEVSRSKVVIEMACDVRIVAILRKMHPETASRSGFLSDCLIKLASLYIEQNPQLLDEFESIEKSYTFLQNSFPEKELNRRKKGLKDLISSINNERALSTLPSDSDTQSEKPEFAFPIIEESEHIPPNTVAVVHPDLTQIDFAHNVTPEVTGVPKSVSDLIAQRASIKSE